MRAHLKTRTLLRTNKVHANFFFFDQKLSNSMTTNTDINGDNLIFHEIRWNFSMLWFLCLLLCELNGKKKETIAYLSNQWESQIEFDYFALLIFIGCSIFLHFAMTVRLCVFVYQFRCRNALILKWIAFNILDFQCLKRCDIWNFWPQKQTTLKPIEFDEEKKITNFS